jgi:hypothetical protein
MKALLIIAILFPFGMIVAAAFIGATILIKKEEGTISPVKLYHIYRKQICIILKNL